MSLNDGTVALNNLLQQKNQLTLLSWEESRSGPHHAPLWTSICKINGQEIARGTGAAKYLARDMAAKAAHEYLTQAAAGQ
ncbi:hypothetical protein POSPLADRAFT_1051173 [Postia placenta MAD-698-R-SB12]|uniref:DRBM domain-containing protein n=1 Tax=Postia placenta MAD-698-R-SB12 TaxID=670580 RepID=A0A1X6NEF6_9APHY|nr:hypothetical protein POSPLADRAFT_1051173 [Postia placenta MAD-698-R-SB12]OSX67017.1 hypothetical protein POSPLADRAFT_1051173 [Postia placenta MAD-698-R-SB12]